MLVFNLPADASNGVRNFDYFVDGVFAIDFIRNFITSYYVDEQIVTSRKQIMRHYATGWMSVDLIAIIPWDNLNENLKALRLLRLLR